MAGGVITASCALKPAEPSGLQPTHMAIGRVHYPVRHTRVSTLEGPTIVVPIAPRVGPPFVLRWRFSLAVGYSDSSGRSFPAVLQMRT